MLRVSTALLLLIASAGSAYAQGDAAAGEEVFKKCAGCHAIGEGAKNKVGPELNGVVGRKAGSVEGFNYSAAMKEAADKGLVWGPDTLNPFLTKPQDFLPGTKMAFPGLSNPDDVANVIAYLASFNADGTRAQ